ncbi:hypothetical protein AGMMS49942_03630 [Spirochaetia bacterium]|nr:hypothetical protein AGMMS49942_03630 [Spirochaetia bacterium]
MSIGDYYHPVWEIKTLAKLVSVYAESGHGALDSEPIVIASNMICEKTKILSEFFDRVEFLPDVVKCIGH